MAARRSPLARTATIATIPSPVGGWNARDPLPEMAAADAVILENLIPGPGGVSLRGGSQTYATGLGAPVNALMRYNPAAGNPRLFAAGGANIFDVTGGGIVGSPVVSGQVGDKWQSVNFANPAGAFLIAANGTDAPQKYDGASWTAMTIATVSGYAYTLTPSKLHAPFVFGQRLWFVESNSLRVWYMPTNAVAASGSTAATAIACLDLSALFRLGGSIVAMASWTRDGGTGSDDFAVLISSAGEVVIYSGYDPTAAPGTTGAFSLVGVFRIAPPIGARCVIQAGADLAILTQQGVVPLSSVLPLALSQAETAAFTDKIRGAFAEAYATASAAFGWEMAEYPRGGLVIVNVPQGDGTYQQFVMNALTGAWCNFTGLSALTWSLSGDNAFFGTPAGTVVQYDDGNEDDGNPINAIALPAFSNFKTLNRKRFLLARPLYSGAIGYNPPIILKTEYDDTRTLLTQPMIPPNGTPWGSPWGSPWGPVIGTSDVWQGIRGEGTVASVFVGISARNSFRLDKIDIQFEGGGAFG